MKEILASFQYYTDIYIDIKKNELKQSSYEKYLNIVNLRILPYFKHMDIEDIKVSTVRVWFNKFASRSPKTRRDYLTVLRGIFQEAYYDEVISKNPVDFIRVPPLQKAKVLPFEKSEINLILEKARNPYRNFYAILFFTGMRSGEVLALKISNIDLDKKLIHIEHAKRRGVESTPKTAGSIRTIPIFPDLIPYLEDQLKETSQYDSYLFLTKELTPYKDYQPITYKYWKKLLERLDIPYRRCYQSRHTLATMLLNSNQFTKNQIAKILGHNSTEMLFKHYAGYMESEMSNINKTYKII
jgi:integrase